MGQIFNVGDYRRKLCGEKVPASFFDPTNSEGVAQRTLACNAALEDMLEYMAKPDVRVAVYDATNSTRERRQHLREKLKSSKTGTKIIFIESICDNKEVCTWYILSFNFYIDVNEIIIIFFFRRNSVTEQKLQ